MIPGVPIAIATFESRPLDVQRRAWAGIVRAALLEQGTHWHTKIFPQHFEPHAAAKYHYRPRTAGWKKRKIALAARGKAIAGGLLDNVFTGEMQRRLTQYAQLRATDKHVTLAMAGPFYISMRPKKANQPDKAAELLSVVPHEAQQLANVLLYQAMARVDRLRGSRTQ